MTRDERSSADGRIQRLLLGHLWACAPFGLLWAIWPEVFGRGESLPTVAGLRILYAIVGVSLVVRSVVAVRWPSWRLTWYLWPIVDVAQITAAVLISQPKPDSWVVFLYALPVIQAGATLDLRWTLFVAALSAAVCGASEGLENFRYTFFAFRLFLLVLVGSLFTRLARELSRSREELALSNYRNELAAEMHDGLQQYLGAISIRLDSVGRSLKDATKGAMEDVLEQADLARTASDELRLMVWRLRAPARGVDGLLQTLERQLAVYRDRTSSQTALVVNGDRFDLSPRSEHALLRIVQEALTNAAKHAQAAMVSVALTFAPKMVLCEVRDDGVGLAEDACSGSSGGLGLENMRSRAESVGGRVEVRGEDGKGTTVRLELPQ